MPEDVRNMRHSGRIDLATESIEEATWQSVGCAALEGVGARKTNAGERADYEVLDGWAVRKRTHKHARELTNFRNWRVNGQRW